MNMSTPEYKPTITITEKEFKGLGDCEVDKDYVVELLMTLHTKSEDKTRGLSETFELKKVLEIEEPDEESEEEKQDKDKKDEKKEKNKELKSKVEDHYR